MKRTNLYGLFICTAALLINSGCNEEALPTGPSSIPPPTYTVPPAAEPPAPLPAVSAGEDLQVIWPTDFCWLSGNYSYVKALDIEKILWEKISGPSSYILEDPESLRTKVSNLEKGIYEFQITITNKKGLIGKDIAKIIVREMSASPKEIVFKDTAWVCPMGCHVEIANLYSQLPAGSVFKIYIQRDNSVNWQEVIHESSQSSADTSYTYTLYNGNLFIFSYSSSEMTDTPNIKLVY